MMPTSRIVSNTGTSLGHSKSRSRFVKSHERSMPTQCAVDRFSMTVFYLRMAACVTAAAMIVFLSACGGGTEHGAPANDAVNTEVSPADNSAAAEEPTPSPTPEIPDLQAEITDGRFRSTSSPFANFDFLNFSYPLPRGWQNPDGADVQLENGNLAANPGTAGEDVSDEEKARLRAERRIGMSHVVTKYFDATGDGQDEAIVILKIETAGNAIPQIVYIFEWKDDKPELIWMFRTGDRTDGGLKDLRPDSGMIVVELYGQDRFLLGEVETGKVFGDDAQLCCPTHFTRSVYKWNGKHFIRQGDRYTYLTADPLAPPIKNMAEVVNANSK